MSDIYSETAAPWGPDTAKLSASAVADYLICRWTLCHGNLTVEADGTWTMHVKRRSRSTGKINIPRDELTQKLHPELLVAENWIRRATDSPLTQRQFDVLIDWRITTSRLPGSVGAVIEMLQKRRYESVIHTILSDLDRLSASRPTDPTHWKAWLKLWTLPEAKTDQDAFAILARL